MPKIFSLALLLTVLVAVGCGGGEPARTSATATPSAAPAKAKPRATPTVAALTSADDLAACSQLERLVQAVSLVVGHTTEGITTALHAKELAKKVDTAQKSLLDSARVVEIFKASKPLAGSQRDFAQGLRMFAADFKRARSTIAKGDMDKATQQLTDEKALRKIQVAAKRIDDLCGA